MRPQTAIVDIYVRNDATRGGSKELVNVKVRPVLRLLDATPCRVRAKIGNTSIYAAVSRFSSSRGTLNRVLIRSQNLK
jgi:hypothetical protein